VRRVVSVTLGGNFLSGIYAFFFSYVHAAGGYLFPPAIQGGGEVEHVPDLSE